jgi:hypothetical protein
VADRSELAFHTIGRIQAIVDMANNPNVYRVTPEKALELIRTALTDFHTEGSEVPRG